MSQAPVLDFAQSQRADQPVRFPVAPPPEGVEYGDWYDPDTNTGTFVIPGALMVDEMGAMLAEIEDKLVAAIEREDMTAAMQHALNYLIRLRTPDAPELRFEWRHLNQIIDATTDGDGDSPLTDAIIAVRTSAALRAGAAQAQQQAQAQVEAGATPLASVPSSRAPSSPSPTDTASGTRTGGATARGGSSRRTSAKPRPAAAR